MFCFFCFVLYLFCLLLLLFVLVDLLLFCCCCCCFLGGYFIGYFIVTFGKFGSPYPGTTQLPQEQRYPFLPVYTMFSCIQTMVWLSVFGSLNVSTDVDAEAGIAQWLEGRTRDRKVAGSNPCRSGGIIFFSRVSFLCWLLFRYPRVTAVARKRPRSFCQKCRWQVTAKHPYTLRMWLCMK